MAAVSVVVSLSLGSSNALTAEEIPTAQIAKEKNKSPVPLYFSYVSKTELPAEEIAEETVPMTSEDSFALSFADVLPSEPIELQSCDTGTIALESIAQPITEPVNTIQAEEIIERQSLEYTDEEKEMIAKVVFAEARGECFDGQVAVAQVVINRYESGGFGKSLKRIVYGRQQFAVGNRYTEACMDAVEYAIDNMPYPTNMFFFQVSKRKHWRDFVYYDRIGNHSFYCLDL